MNMIRNSAACLMWLVAINANAADADHGKALYMQMCSACHSVDYNGVGPRHRGVFGRQAGSLPGYAYSPALKKALLVWDEANLNQWLTDPESVAPGQKMGFMVPAAADRADLIAYLKTLTP
jgi:cytochrome c